MLQDGAAQRAEGGVAAEARSLDAEAVMAEAAAAVEDGASFLKESK